MATIVSAPAPAQRTNKSKSTQRLVGGYAAAVSLVFFVLVLTVSGVQRFLTREKA